MENYEIQTIIRPAEPSEAERCLEIFNAARRFMRSRGNMNQWVGGYPGAAEIANDIEKGQLFVMEENGRVGACFAFIIGEDPTYGYIEGEGWKDSSVYGTIHRLGTDGSIRNCMHKCTEFAKTRCPHLRVDTHEDNHVMQQATLREGFVYCGVIYLENGDPRLAYELIPEVRK